MIRHRILWIVGLLALVVATDARAEQTIVFLRHGEKPSGGYGQLTCQGFNRALVPVAGSARQSDAGHSPPRQATKNPVAGRGNRAAFGARALSVQALSRRQTYQHWITPT